MLQANNLSCSESSEITAKVLNVTNTSSSLPAPQAQLKKTKLCWHYGGEEEGETECPAERALEWLKKQGIERGKPEDLFDKAREEKRVEICQKVGKEDKPVILLGSPLLNRRLKRGSQWPPLHDINLVSYFNHFFHHFTFVDIWPIIQTNHHLTTTKLSQLIVPHKSIKRTNLKDLIGL